ncbi:hypothetical protein N0M98_17150 [Paenibacillus doosanensis]|uniref:hypothetical protein n=1 Tax=Paenibacillus doosanensis TaxID=1229154 RepID=UPI00217FCBC4|nr:hypothetical protein [Paenibacillus doosanensis]MCS7461866.1 hypothetical protein [Paenibacillus doosanensis]
MFKNKSMLYGLGIGLIAGSALLQLMNFSAPAAAVQGRQDADDMDPQQLKQAASVYYQVYEKDQKLYSQSQADALVQQKLKESSERQTAADGAKQPEKEVYIYISKGMNAGDVAELLLQSGVIPERKPLEDEMWKQRLNDKIVAGLHVFKGPQELAQVLSNLTSQ